MKKIIVSLALCLTIIISLVPMQVYAGSMTIWGRVINSRTGASVPGASIRLYDPSAGLDSTVYANSSGYYYFYYRNFCNLKNAYVRKTGFYALSTRISDGTCPECYPPNNTRRCSTMKVQNFYLIPSTYGAAEEGMASIQNESFNNAIIAALMYFWMFNDTDFDNIGEFIKAITDIDNWVPPFDGYDSEPSLDVDENVE